MRTQGLILFLSFTGSLFAGRIDSLSIQLGEYEALHESGPLSGDGLQIAIVSGCGGDLDCSGLRSVVDLTTMTRTDVEFSEIKTLSSDGTFVGGRAYDESANIWGPAIWNSGVLQVIHPARNSRSYVSHISTDGRAVAGRLNGDPFVGTSTDIVHPQGAPKMEGEIVAMSNDGRFFGGYTFVDTAGAGTSRTIAFRWTQANGYEPIGAPQGTWSTRASAMSQDGTIIAGTSSNNDGETSGFRWVDGKGFQDLGSFIPTGSSGNGGTLVGYFDAEQAALRVPAIWDEANGAREFTSYVIDEQRISLDVPGWTQLHGITGISNDGRTIIGYGHNKNGESQFVVRTGEIEACDLNADMSCNAADIDAFAEIKRSKLNRSSFDLDLDGAITDDDRNLLLEEMRVWPGDSNLDGEFNTGDFISVFQAGHYEDAIVKNSGWSEGDWNGDGEFDSGDFITAFQGGGYEQGPRAPVRTVPEPSGLLGLTMGLVACVRHRRNCKENILKQKFTGLNTSGPTHNVG